MGLRQFNKVKIAVNLVEGDGKPMSIPLRLASGQSNGPGSTMPGLYEVVQVFQNYAMV